MADDILSTAEIDHIIQNFTPSSLDVIGSAEWFKSREKLCKLYQVAVIEVRTESPERIKTAVSIENKLSDLVKDLFSVSVWKEKVLPEVLCFSPRPEQSFPTYIILYNEVMLIGLLEALMFHGEMFWELGDLCLDLIEYAVHKITNLDQKKSFLSHSLPKDEYDAKKEIKEYIPVMDFAIASSCITILRYVAENFDKVPLSAAKKVYSDFDIPVIVSQIILKDVWSYKVDGKIYKYDQNKWREWFPDDPLLSPIQCQTWLLIRQLLLNTTCDTVYYYSSYRKEHLSNLTSLLYDTVIDQLSPLADLKIWLHRLSISGDQQDNTSNPVIMEISESYCETLIRKYNGKWKKLAMENAGLLLYPKHDDVVKLAKYFAGGLDGMEVLAENINSCNLCYAKALKRCSKCQRAWYCSRKCQVEHWKTHKSLCCK